jgi:hypothetical protein
VAALPGAGKEIKKVPLDEVFPEHHVLIGVGLDPK